jgi:hypothetical protein
MLRFPSKISSADHPFYRPRLIRSSRAFITVLYTSVQTAAAASFDENYDLIRVIH